MRVQVSAFRHCPQEGAQCRRLQSNPFEVARGALLRTRSEISRRPWCLRTDRRDGEGACENRREEDQRRPGPQRSHLNMGIRLEQFRKKMRRMLEKLTAS